MWIFQASGSGSSRFCIFIDYHVLCILGGGDSELKVGVFIVSGSEASMNKYEAVQCNWTADKLF